MSDTPAATVPGDQATTTRLNRPWLAKMAIFTVVLIGFGFYGLYDATVAYPARGERFASYAQFEYLKLATERSGYLSRDLAIQDPVGELRRIREIRNPNPETAARKQWLEALEVIGQLRPERTTFQGHQGDPQAAYADLRRTWMTEAGARAAPKPLSWWDIPVQWVFVAVGFGFGAWLIILWITVARQTYRWDPQSLSLTLPDGQTTIRPDDLEDVDKRKWDKFLVFLRLKSGHPLAGQELKLDLYRYAPLETWVLEMEKAAFPDRAEAAPAPEPEAA